MKYNFLAQWKHADKVFPEQNIYCLNLQKKKTKMQDKKVKANIAKGSFGPS